MRKAAEASNDLPMAFSKVEEIGKQLLLARIGDAKELLELLHGLILHAEIFRVFQHKVDEYTLYRRQQDIAAVSHAVPHELQRALVTGECLRRAAMDHAWKLIKEKDKCEPAMWRLGPLVQLACECALGESTETLAGFFILFGLVAEPEAILCASYLSSGGALTEPPVQQFL